MRLCFNIMGILKVEIDYNVSDALEIIKKFLKDNKINIFGIIDHRKNAIDAGMDMNDETLIMFGSPAVGTGIMIESPEIGIELPTKILLYSINDKTYAVYKNIKDLEQEYGITKNKESLEKLDGLINKIINMLKK
ncbi:hypothetical protein AOG55_03965 [Acidiplasma cupricumulans]|uniref:DUF302 domain-containing protein n=2 Tax=Acidiplasma TaxID=507753 RepID=A0A0N8VLG9_9ARCH|nr:hypothetical protein AOG55_03965 [Acidiplasma cupricumulans]